MAELSVNDLILPMLTKDKRVKILVGGRGSGKSVGVADLILLKCREGKSILAAREFQTSIEDSVHSLLEDRINHYNLKGFTVTAKDISFKSTGGRIFYKGLARNISSLKSLGAVDICWIEEGESIGDKSLQTLTPSIRSIGETPPEIWITMNRHSMQGAVSIKYLKRAESDLASTGTFEDNLLLAVQLNYADNPWFPNELDMERLDDKDRLSPSQYAHVWDGAYYDEFDNSIIKSEWFESCIDSHIKLGFKAVGQRVLAYDPSDEGGDDKAYVIRHGSVIEECEVLSEGDIATGTDWALSTASDRKCDVFTWDCDGMGIAIKRQVAASFNNYIMFKGSESPEDKHSAYLNSDQIHIAVNKTKSNQQTFRNKRAQYYWRLRDRFYATHRAVVDGGIYDADKMISISSGSGMDIARLRYEVCRIALKNNPNGMIQIVSKPDMARMGLKSPNRADALMMSMLNPEADTTFDIEFESIW